jgi:hypothetical protein
MKPATESPTGTRPETELKAVNARVPPGHPLNLGVDATTLLIANAVVIHYLIIGEMTPFELVVLVALEALLLSGIARTQRLLVPVEARIRPAGTGRSPIATLVFGIAWLLVTYLLVFWMFFDIGAEVAAALADPSLFLWQPQIRWPLSITLAGAVVDALSDHLHFRKGGGHFVSTVEFNALARLLTLLLGAIPFFVPLVVFAVGIFVLIKRIELRQMSAGVVPVPKALLALVVLLGALAVGMAVIISGLFAAGITGWAIGYVSAKLAGEALVVALPTIVE